MKTLRGSKGVGVLFIDSEKGLDSIVQLIHKQDEDSFTNTKKGIY